MELSIPLFSNCLKKVTSTTHNRSNNKYAEVSHVQRFKPLIFLEAREVSTKIGSFC